jgi:hypothetical protein
MIGREVLEGEPVEEGMASEVGVLIGLVHWVR